MSEAKLYRPDWSHDEANLAYDNSRAVANVLEITHQWRTDSDALASQWPHQETISYGTHSREHIQLFLPSQVTDTLMIFIHGGYWQMRAKEDFYFLSKPYLSRGIAMAYIGYPLAPEYPLRAIVQSVDHGLRKLQDQYGHLFKHQTLCGWSAGAHLALMSESNAWINQRLLISGIYDLAPLVKTRFFPALQVSEEELLTLSPQHRSIKPNTHLWVGQKELPELQRQSIDYSTVNSPNGTLSIIPNCNHFTVLNMLLIPSRVYPPTKP